MYTIKFKQFSEISEAVRKSYFKLVTLYLLKILFPLNCSNTEGNLVDWFLFSLSSYWNIKLFLFGCWLLFFCFFFQVLLTCSFSLSGCRTPEQCLEFCLRYSEQSFQFSRPSVKLYSWQCFRWETRAAELEKFHLA